MNNIMFKIAQEFLNEFYRHNFKTQNNNIESIIEPKNIIINISSGDMFRTIKLLDDGTIRDRELKSEEIIDYIKK